jgi:hypothetical protein
MRSRLSPYLYPLCPTPPRLRASTGSLAVAVRAFREMTVATDDAAATRARVLAGAERGRRPHGMPRRIAGPMALRCS